MSTIRFEPNVPLELALKYDTGKQVQSRIVGAPDQMMYTICGDDTIYVPLDTAADIIKLGIKKMELISICKRVQGKATRWTVNRVSDAAPLAPPTQLESQLTRSIEQAQQQKAQRALVAPAAPLQPAPTQERKGVSQPNSIQHTRMSKIMAAAMIAAVDAIRETERYAVQHGIPVQPLEVEFTAEDIRTVAATMFIQASKDPLFLAPQQVNGGATWQPPQ